MTGPLHGGANEEVLEMLDEIGSIDNVRKWLEDAVANKKKVMGFGHRVYKVKDPRATVLQEMAENVFVETGRPKDYEMAMELERLAAGMPNLGQKGIYPERRFLLGHGLSEHRHSARPVHAGVRHRARGRLAGPLAGTNQE